MAGVGTDVTDYVPSFCVDRERMLHAKLDCVARVNMLQMLHVTSWDMAGVGTDVTCCAQFFVLTQ